MHPVQKHYCPVLQIPWRALGSQPVVVELTGVWLVAAPRDESDWEEGPAGRRAEAAKEAQLAAAEMGRVSKTPGTGAEAPRGMGWSFISNLGVILLNRLQFKVNDVHICYQVSLGFCQ